MEKKRERGWLVWESRLFICLFDDLKSLKFFRVVNLY